MNKDAHYPDPSPPMPALMTASTARLSLIAALLLLLTACASSPAPRAPPPAARTFDASPNNPSHANNVLIRALGLVGTPYRWGGNTPESGFDCSGLVAFVFRDAAGLGLPRTTRELARMKVPEPPKSRLASGDLVLFGNRGGVNHVGIYVGEGRFVHAPNEGGTVRLDRLDGHYWRDSYLGAKRVLD